MSDPRPLILLTAGDPAGIGPEVVVRSLADPALSRLARVVVLGDRTALPKALARLGRPLDLALVDDLGQAAFDSGRLNLLTVSRLDQKDHSFGRTNPACGQAAYLAIVKAVDLILAGRAEALCTAPISKASLQAAGHKFPGHTELLAELTKSPAEPVMCLAGPRLKVSLVTTHLAYAEVPARLNQGKILQVIGLSHDFLLRLGVKRPRLAVCGLNPHAGEEGLFGREEIETIAPAVAEARAAGFDVSGPEPADTVFFRAVEGERFHLVVAMYHDQGLIPLKLLHFRNGVNVTLGLPIVRTSPDHGTAFDLADSFRADPESLKSALRLAACLARPSDAGNAEIWA